MHLVAKSCALAVKGLHHASGLPASPTAATIDSVAVDTSQWCKSGDCPACVCATHRLSFSSERALGLLAAPSRGRRSATQTKRSCGPGGQHAKLPTGAHAPHQTERLCDACCSRLPVGCTNWPYVHSTITVHDFWGCSTAIGLIYYLNGNHIKHELYTCPSPPATHHACMLPGPCCTHPRPQASKPCSCQRTPPCSSTASLPDLSWAAAQAAAARPHALAGGSDGCSNNGGITMQGS